MPLGDKVHHPSFGPGRILAVRDRGVSVQIEFDSGVRRWLKSAELGDGSAAPAAPIPPRLPPRPVHRKRFAARILVEALRLGVVPVSEVAKFTFGRGKELAITRSWLASKERNVLLVVGEYGAGKTHLLEAVRAQAIEGGFGTAAVTLDINESPLYRPKRVYRRLVESLRYRDGGGNLKEFKDLLIDSSRTDSTIWREHPLLRRIRDRLRTGTLEDWRWEWISGQDTYYKDDLHDETTAANVYSNLRATISLLLKDAVGSRGLVLLFDEAENLDIAVTAQQARRAFNFFHGLTLVAQHDDRLLREKVEWGSAFSPLHGGVDWGLHGVRTDLRYSGRNTMRFTPALPVPLKLVFAFAPSTLTDEPALTKFERLDLEPLGTSALADALKEVTVQYTSAHGFKPRPEHRAVLVRALKALNIDLTRTFLKASIEALDLLRLYPKEDPAELLTNVI